MGPPLHSNGSSAMTSLRVEGRVSRKRLRRVGGWESPDAPQLSLSVNGWPSTPSSGSPWRGVFCAIMVAAPDRCWAGWERGGGRLVSSSHQPPRADGSVGEGDLGCGAWALCWAYTV